MIRTAINAPRTIITLREHCQQIISYILQENQPTNAVISALKDLSITNEHLYLLSIGKAAWTMAHAATLTLPHQFERGIVITKEGHSNGSLDRCQIFEASHPVVDNRGLIAGKAACLLSQNLGEEDHLIFLISGGGSALFESSSLPLPRLQAINEQLLHAGANIVEINTIRKRLSQVKGGKFARLCAPAHISCIILSDVLGDRLDSIASGPAAPDTTTTAQALEIAQRYQLEMDDELHALLTEETPKTLTNVTHQIIGSVDTLCNAAAHAAKDLGYQPIITDTAVSCDVYEHAHRFTQQAKELLHQISQPTALIAGGECTVTVKGKGKGGRNQEFALIAAQMIQNTNNIVLFSLGSDGTDGPTDAAGGICDGESLIRMSRQGIIADKALQNNDSYHALHASNDLIVTGPTGTNVNDVQVALIYPSRYLDTGLQQTLIS